MRVIVTGGAGFIGSALVRRIIAEGDQLLNVDKLTYAGRLETLGQLVHHRNYFFLRADVADAPTMVRITDEFKPDVIFHLAAESHVDRSIDSPSAFIETNVRGTYSVIEAALRYWTKMDVEGQSRFRVIHVSSDEVYGSLGHDGRFRHDSPYRPNSPYSASKAAADHFCRAWHSTYGLPVIISVSSNNYGPYQHPEKLIPTVIRHALAGTEIPVYGDGLHRRDWLHVEDHIEGLMRVFRCGRVGETYLFGGRTDLANIDLVRMLCGTLDQLRPRGGGKYYADQIAFVDDRPGHDFRYAVDPIKAESELGWSVQRSPQSGLPETVAWYLANPFWLQGAPEDLGRLGLARTGESA